MKINQRRLITALSVVGCTIVAAPSLALDAISIDVKPVESGGFVGLGLGFATDYEGSDDVTFGALPTAQYSFGKRFVRLIGTNLSANLLEHEVLQIGPSLNYRFGRNDVDDDVVDRMADVDGAVEIGAMAGLSFTNGANARYRFNASVEFLTDVTDEHDGSTIRLSARYWRPISKAFDVSIGIGGTYATDNYMSSFFSVNAADAAASGLPIFVADAGVKDFDVSPMVVMHLSRSWHVGLGARFKWLLGDAADSPVVDSRGSSTQILAGLGVIYSW